MINPPKIVEFSPDSYDFTEVVFEPDFSRFKMKGGLDNDTVMLLSKRVYDLAGVTPACVGVYLNGKKLQVKNFEQYCDMYLPENPVKFHMKEDRWEVCVSQSATFQFQ